MDNCTSTLNCTSELKSAGFAVFCILTSLVIASAILLDVLTIAGLLLQSAVPRLLKVLLLNLLTASIMSGIVWGLINLAGSVLALSEIPDPFDPICRVGISLWHLIGAEDVHCGHILCSSLPSCEIWNKTYEKQIYSCTCRWLMVWCHLS